MKQTFINNHFENLCVIFSKLIPAFFGQSTFRVHGELLGSLVSSNHISLEGIHRFSSSVELKAEPHFQSNIYLDPNFEVKIPLCSFNIVVPRNKSLSSVKKVQRQHNNKHNTDSLCIFHLSVTYFLFL